MLNFHRREAIGESEHIDQEGILFLANRDLRKGSIIQRPDTITISERDHFADSITIGQQVIEEGKQELIQPNGASPNANRATEPIQFFLDDIGVREDTKIASKANNFGNRSIDDRDSLTNGVKEGMFTRHKRLIGI